MNQRVMVSASAVALVALVAGGAALALQSKGAHTPKRLTVQGGGASATSNVAADRASGLMAPNSNLVFVLSGDLPALDGGRPAWHLAANPTADPATVAALAKALGVAGVANTVEGGWQVGDPQGTGPNLFVSSSPGLPWNYSNYAGSKMAYACASSGGAGPDNASTTSAPPPTCPAPAPPTGVPTKEAALAKAGDLMKALGIDASSLSITVNASEWSADVQAVPSLGGIAAPTLTTSFGFGGEGKLQYANGFLLAPEKADTYPRIGTTKAFEALKSGKGFAGWFTYGGPMTRNAVGMAEPATTVPAGYPSGAGATTVFRACPTVDPASATPPPAPPTCTCGAVAVSSDVPASTVACPPVPCSLAASATTAVDQAAMPNHISCGPIECGVAVTTIPGPPSTTVPCAPMPCRVAGSAAAAALDQTATSDGISCGPIECAGVVVTTIPGPPSTTVSCGPVPCPLAASATTAVDQTATPNHISCGPIACGGGEVTTISGTAAVDATTAALMPMCPQPRPLPVPAPVTITITGVHDTLLPLTGADGSMWLVPGYDFTSADGGTWPVLGIDQSFVDQVAPNQPIPANARGGVPVTPIITVPPPTTTTAG